MVFKELNKALADHSGGAEDTDWLSIFHGGEHSSVQEDALRHWEKPFRMGMGTLRRYVADDGGFGRMGVAAPSPATVVHSRTYQRFTKPLVTYGSARAIHQVTRLE
jgi:hypothetical protein